MKSFRFGKEDIDEEDIDDKKSIGSEFREKIKDIIWDRMDLLKDLEESEMRLRNAIEELQRCYEEYRKAKSAMERSEREVADLIEKSQQ